MRSYLFPSVVTLQVYDAARSEWPRPLILSYEPILGLQVDSAAPLLSHRPSFGLQSERINSPKKNTKKKTTSPPPTPTTTNKKEKGVRVQEREREREREKIRVDASPGVVPDRHIHHGDNVRNHMRHRLRSSRRRQSKTEPGRREDKPLNNDTSD